MLSNSVVPPPSTFSKCGVDFSRNSFSSEVMGLSHECFSGILKPSSSLATSLIVGLSSPFTLKHSIARFATSFTCSKFASLIM
ncbi:hypothetical protein L6164_023435 [Bauhinia variegata]|uniref:Uncharacterized protein n=1 Tax=Bauhinia variegata TaxID=167791 RepID=A0ACB9MIC6_BAUVA|nr:hypothetical protein L6164_023435 [Bauhinia variegata]